MLLVMHIIFAVASLGLMAGALVGKLQSHSNNYDTVVHLSFWSFAGLIITGTILVIKLHQHIMGACLEGLLYFGILVILYFAYLKMATFNL